MTTEIPAQTLEQQLLSACTYGDQETVRDILARGSVDVNFIESRTNDCALLIAARHQHWNIARMILQTNEVKVETEQQQKTPLMYAAMAGHYEMVIRLLGAGADVNRTDNKKETSLIFACRGKYVKIIDTLLSSTILVNAANCRYQTALHEAAKQCDVQVVTMLRQKGAEHTAQDIYGNTPLMYACQLGSYNCAAFLISQDTINETNAAGRTALHLAAASRHHAVVRLLLESGSKVTIRDKDGNTALLTAIGQVAGERTALVLLNADVRNESVGVAGRLQKSALHYACVFGYVNFFRDIVDRIEKLTDADDYLNAEDIHGGTPLSMAVQGGVIEIVERLLRLNCRPRGPLVRVAWRDHGPPMLPMLLSQGAYANHSCRADMPSIKCVEFHERIRSRVQSLRFHSRLAVRRALPSGGDFERRVQSLGLPSKLANYMQFHEYVYS